MSGTATALVITGVVLELAGIVLVGSPDLVPYGRRLSAWLRLLSSRVVNRVLRLIGRPRTRTITVGAAVAGSSAMSASAVTSVREGASLEDQVAFLLRRDQEAQRHETEFSTRIRTLEEDSPKRLEELRGRMEEHVAGAIAEAHRAYLEARLLGVLLLAAGLGCVTAASFF